MSERWEEIVHDLERWYFGGLTFAESKERTEVGDWRDIVNEAAKRIAALERELAERDSRVTELETRSRIMRDAFCIIRDIAARPQVVEIARRFAEEDANHE